MTETALAAPLSVPDTIQPEGALRLLGLLRATGYRFVTPTPSTHRQVLRHPGKQRARDVRDVLGWSLPFDANIMAPDVLAALVASGAIRETAEGLRATIRVSSVDDDLFIHSAFPPEAEDAVFLGPDTYRFARLLKATLANATAVVRLVDIGTGTGAGAVVAARVTGAKVVVVTDVNPRALAIARINLAAAGIEAETCRGRGLAGAPGDADLIIANPPFIAGTDRIYRGGGDMLGARISLDWTMEAVDRLRPGGRFVLYTGSAIVDGRDGLREALEAEIDLTRYDLAYEELDPDIFGGQLSASAYQEVERIAAVGAIVQRRRPGRSGEAGLACAADADDQQTASRGGDAGA
jgi:SAM-dependent methyltransferase